MSQKQKNNTLYATLFSRQMVLKISICLMLFPVVFACFVLFASGFDNASLSYLLLAVPYIIIIALSWLMLQDKLTSVMLRRVTILLNIFASGSVLLLIFLLFFSSSSVSQF